MSNSEFTKPNLEELKKRFGDITKTGGKSS